MALIYDLPVFNDVYGLSLRLFQLTSNFPREYKFTLGQDMKRDCINLVRYIYRANKSKEKTQYLEEFLDHFEILKFEIRYTIFILFVEREIYFYGGNAHEAFQDDSTCHVRGACLWIC
jgi:hypothetical protein